MFLPWEGFFIYLKINIVFSKVYLSLSLHLFFLLVRSCLFITLIKCLIVCGSQAREIVTFELSSHSIWTAKNT